MDFYNVQILYVVYSTKKYDSSVFLLPWKHRFLG